MIIERTDENERFYGERIGVADILAGKARHPPYEIKMLMETVKAAEGRSDVDKGMMEELEDQPAPGDVNVEEPTTKGPIFGIPEPDDPDPFGVLALENAGLEIREASTKSRPPSSQFEFNPSPTSPVYGKFNRRSMDTLATRSNRESYMSTLSTRTMTSIERSMQTVSMGTQTDETLSPPLSPNRSNERIVEEDEKAMAVEPEEIDYTKIDLGPYSNLNHSQEFDGTTMNDSPRDRDGDARTASIDNSYVTEDEEEEEPVIFEAASAQATILTPQAIKARGGLVNIPKRPPPPPLPPRSTARTSKVMVDQGSGRSPTKEGFEEVDLHGRNRKNSDLEKPTSPIVLTDMEKEDAVAKIETPGVNGEHLDANEEKDREAIKHDSKELHEVVVAPAVKDDEDGKESDAKQIAGLHELKDALKSEDSEDKDDFHSIPTTPNEIQVK